MPEIIFADIGWVDRRGIGASGKGGGIGLHPTTEFKLDAEVSVRTFVLLFVAALLPGTAAKATQPYSEQFSTKFKAAVDNAMSQPTADGRTRLLMEAMHGGTDSEVFFVFPLLFPRRIIDAAQNAHVCVAEISSSINNGKAYLAASPTERDDFPHAQAKKIRSDTDRLIMCLDRYYANGQLRLPSQSSN